MTGYAYFEEQDSSERRSVEIKSYNSRYLDISMVLPAAFSRYETDARALVAAWCRRGKIELSLKVEGARPDFTMRVNQSAVRAYFDAIHHVNIEAVRARLPQSEHISVERFLTLPGVIEVTEDERADDERWAPLRALLERTLSEFDAARSREGEHTLRAVLTYLDAIEEAAREIARFVPAVEAAIKQNILRRFEELAVEGDRNRALAEVALLLMKYTIAEELSRLSAHITEFRAEALTGAGAGKKLEFRVQEMSREINTIGAKSYLIEVSQLVVLMKDALENIREQLRNIE
jgi:uncharacterized protein (TIGR00255 family)